MLVAVACEVGEWATVKLETGTSDAQKSTSFPGDDVNRKGGNAAGPVIQTIDPHVLQHNHHTHSNHCTIFHSQNLQRDNEEWLYKLGELPFDRRLDILDGGVTGLFLS